MTERARDHLGRYGIWRWWGGVTPELAAGLERLGFGTLWLGGSPSGDLSAAEQVLDATTTLTVATGIVNVWRDPDPAAVASSFARVEARHPGRFLLGVGIGHPEATKEYARPYETLVSYVDGLLDGGVPADSLVLAALGPRVLRLAADRTAGAHPYLVPPEYTRQAREILGAGPVLAPEQKAVLEADPERARAIGRPRVQVPYLGAVNYLNNLRRLGWSDEDLSNGGSDALIDALVAHGTDEQVAARVNAHLDAGADHVCVQLLTPTDDDLLGDYTHLASALGLWSST
jgi:probable F420-dependent oxidoreductase